MIFQQSHGDFSPNINGSNNQTNQNCNNIKTGSGCKVRYTLLGFLIGVATSYVGSYLYDNYKIEKIFGKNQIENSITNQSKQIDSIPLHKNQ